METTIEAPNPAASARAIDPHGGIIDCDVHNALKPGELLRYLPRRWHSYYEQMPGRIRAGLTVGARPGGISRNDTTPPSGGPPASDLDFLRAQLIERHNVDHAILTSLDSFFFLVQHGEIGAAMARALNEWIAAAWLDEEPRFVSAISVPQEDGILAAAEIERVAASDPRFVSVLMMVLTREPLGHSKYWPIYDAASELGLPVIAHVGGWSGADTPAGWPASHIESHCAWPQAYVAQTVSLVCSGVFNRFPKLKIIMQEGGIGWIPATMWRLDRAWRVLGEHLPHLDEPPSEIIRRHWWFTTQPMEEPERAGQLSQLLDQIGMDDKILFSSDYPHHDFDDPRRAIPVSLGDERRAKILRGNAEALFGFPAPSTTRAAR